MMPVLYDATCIFGNCYDIIVLEGSGFVNCGIVSAVPGS